jgi:hypothetical protein
VPAILEDEMTRRDTMPVRLGHDAIEVAKKAASLKGMTLTDYATAVLMESANRDIDEFARDRIKAKRPKKAGRESGDKTEGK